ncbi:hypothetical protein AK812_SmicGene932 [Symbiodinium microadriaticum]|uniref:Uncharacterized protein n=1 Tax=Symbiodinium microadriaticum TaxID=2951 RepID=A0A1Q9F5I8_SYMMI|nr:hypothetical protein AK812_SmicGene932 [Symbiodinium microadriaticum]
MSAEAVCSGIAVADGDEDAHSDAHEEEEVEEEGEVWYEWAVTSPTPQPIHNPGGRSCASGKFGMAAFISINLESPDPRQAEVFRRKMKGL